MTITAIRFRTEGVLLALQVCVEGVKPSEWFNGREQQAHIWRDATVEDLLDVAVFVRPIDSRDYVNHSTG